MICCYERSNLWMKLKRVLNGVDIKTAIFDLFGTFVFDKFFSVLVSFLNIPIYLIFTV